MKRWYGTKEDTSMGSRCGHKFAAIFFVFSKSSERIRHLTGPGNSWHLTPWNLAPLQDENKFWPLAEAQLYAVACAFVFLKLTNLKLLKKKIDRTQFGQDP